MSIRNHIDVLLRRFEKEFVVQNHISVSRGALLHNYDFFSRTTKQQVIPVLKGNAYGHGIEQVVKALKDRQTPYIAVDGYFEALRIRRVSKQPVLIMGSIAPENFARLVYKNFAFVVHDVAAIDALGRTGKRIAVHLECNTGMNRYGAKLADVAMLTEHILQYKNLRFEGVMSHLADSDGSTSATVKKAVAEFDACVEAVRAAGANPTIIHVAQTAGSMVAVSKYANTMRLGIGLYGINPFASQHKKHESLCELRPALQLHSTIAQIISLQKGDKVSYNYTFTAPKAMKIGVLPIGYYEGVNRALSNKGYVKIGDQFAPIVGRVCMNHTMINLQGIDVEVGERVVVYSSDSGDKNSIDAVAQNDELFNYNLLTALNSDVRRTLIE